MFVLGSSLISTNESQDFNFPFHKNNVFKDQNKNDEVIEPSKSMDLIRRNELRTAPNSQF